jgi:hypothetical protein
MKQEFEIRTNYRKGNKHSDVSKDLFFGTCWPVVGNWNGDPAGYDRPLRVKLTLNEMAQRQQSERSSPVFPLTRVRIGKP